tara:strand:+ start:444 stop:626 length:183 start_codon:yes stop_codon:yes gene_type:complete
MPPRNFFSVRKNPATKGASACSGGRDTRQSLTVRSGRNEKFTLRAVFFRLAPVTPSLSFA